VISGGSSGLKPFLEAVFFFPIPTVSLFSKMNQAIKKQKIWTVSTGISPFCTLV